VIGVAVPDRVETDLAAGAIACPVGFQNPVVPDDLRFQAAGS
jgi:hypothetical protein